MDDVLVFFLYEKVAKIRFLKEKLNMHPSPFGQDYHPRALNLCWKPPLHDLTKLYLSSWNAVSPRTSFTYRHLEKDETLPGIL